MKAGDIVQVRQFDWLPEGTVAKPPVKTGASSVWVFARVVEVGATSVKVKIQHPGNRRHREEVDVPAADVRTKADVEALGAKASPELKKHFAEQAKRMVSAA